MISFAAWLLMTGGGCVVAIVTKDPIAKLLFSLTADNKVSPKEIISGIRGSGKE